MAAFQVVALAWIAAWQARAAQQVRQLNGAVDGTLSELTRRVAHLEELLGADDVRPT